MAETKSTTGILSLGLEYDAIKNIGLSPGLSYNWLRPIHSGEGLKEEQREFSSMNYRLLTTYSRPGALSEIYAGLSYTTIFPHTVNLFGNALMSDEWFTVLPNPELREEESRNVSVGARFSLPNVGAMFDISLYYSGLTDMIADVTLSDSTAQYRNLESARRIGADLVAQYNISQGFGALLSYSYLDAKNTSPDRTSDRLTYLPRHTIKLVSSLLPAANTELNLITTFVSSRQYESLGEWESLGSYWLLDAHVNLKVWEGNTLFAKVSNLFDENYESRYGYPQPGRGLLIGVNLAR